MAKWNRSHSIAYPSFYLNEGSLLQIGQLANLKDCKRRTGTGGSRGITGTEALFYELILPNAPPDAKRLNLADKIEKSGAVGGEDKKF